MPNEMPFYVFRKLQNTKLKTKKQPQFKSYNTLRDRDRETEWNRQADRQTDLRSFFEDFLDVVLAKVSVASFIDLADERDRLGFRNRHDPDTVRSVTWPLRCLPDPEHDRPERHHCRAFNRRSSHADWCLLWLVIHKLWMVCGCSWAISQREMSTTKFLFGNFTYFCKYSFNF
jgi:hypothetical protein